MRSSTVLLKRDIVGVEVLEGGVEVSAVVREARRSLVSRSSSWAIWSALINSIKQVLATMASMNFLVDVRGLPPNRKHGLTSSSRACCMNGIS